MDPNAELEEQMKMLEGLNLDDGLAANPMAGPAPVAPTPTTPPEIPIETAQTLTGEVPFGTITAPLGQPIPENPTAAPIVTNTVAQPVQPTPAPVNLMSQSPAAAPVMPGPVQTSVASSYSAPSQATPAVDLNQAPVFVNLGESTYQTKTDYLKLKENEATRVALINYNAIGTHFHYENGLGYFKCLSVYGDPASDWPTSKGICCLQPNPDDPTKIIGKGKIKVFLPVIEYPVSRADGKTIIQGAKPKLKVLALSKQEYNSLSGVKNEYGEDTASFDLSITRKKSDRGGFLEYILTPGPSWRNKFANDVAIEAAKLDNEVYNLAVSEYAKALSEERITQFYNDKQQEAIAMQQFASQPMPDASQINLNM